MNYEPIELARSRLFEEKLTCVITKDGDFFTSRERGVKPLLDLLEGSADLNGAYAADKVVGKAAAFLYVLLCVKEVYAVVVSEPALAVLSRNGIKTTYETLVPAIRNRTDTGFCPMETAVSGLDNAGEALNAIKKKLKELAK